MRTKSVRLGPLGSTLVAVGLLQGFTMPAPAQSYSIAWYSTAGGGTGAGVGFVVSGTVGQPGAAWISDGRYAIDDGSWSFPAPSALVVSEVNISGAL